MSYDNNNVFAKILRGEIPCEKIYEDEFVLSFYDVNPQKKIHALVIPKGKYINLDDFNENASDEEIVALSKIKQEYDNKNALKRAQNDPVYRSFLEAAERAVKKLSKFEKLPLDLYSHWDKISINFTPI